MLDGLWFFWIAEGHAAEGLRWARWAVDEAPNAPPEQRDLGLLDASELFRFFGQPAEGLRIKRELLPRLREASPSRHFPATLSDTADMLAEAGEFEEARELARKAVALRRDLGIPSGINHALMGLAMVEFRAGQFARAQELSEEALALVEKPSVPTNALYTALLAGESARRCGDRSSARRYLLQALRLSIELGHRSTFAELLQEIAAASMARADSVRLLSASEGLLREVGLPRWDPRDYKRTIAELRATLGNAVFEEAWTDGAALSENEVLSLAAACLD
jgi:tetratricopeptide (TPR) repeat protein